MPEEAASEPTATLTTLCKFHCGSVEPAYPNLPECPARRVRMITLYDPDLDEDRRFCKATPMGSMEFLVENPALDGFFVTGKSYLIEVRPA